jgi:DNA-directed RNA polymerase subunit RPC12/RpoP
MATKAWKCLKCGEMNDPNEEFREVASNTCTNCKSWRYLYYGLGSGGLAVIVGLGLMVTTLLGI